MPATPSSSSQSDTCSSICEHCGTNTGLERIDGTKVNDLITYIRDRLSRDAHGNFFIQGAKTGKDTRHGQLGDLFSLKAQLEGFEATMKAYIALHAPKETVKPEKPFALNQSTTAVVATMVEQQLEAPLRDLRIRCQRLEEEQKKREKKDELVEGLLKKLRKARATGTNALKVDLAECKHDDSATKAAVAKLQVTQNVQATQLANVTGAQNVQATQIADVEEVLAKTQKKNATVPRKPAESEALLDQLDGAIGKFEMWQDRKEGQVKELDEAVADLQEWKGEFMKWMLEVDGWRQEAGEWREGVAADVQTLFDNL